MSCSNDVTVKNRPIVVRIGPGAPRPIVVTATQAQQIRSGQAARGVTVRNPLTPVQVKQPVVAVVSANKVGPAGPAGRDGSAPAATYPIGEVIHGLRVVRVEGGQVFHPDTAVLDHAQSCIGIATQSATVGDVLVQLGGTLTENSWAWDDGAVWCGPDGSLTQNPASTGWLLCVGRAISPTTLMIDLDTPIARN